MAEPQGEVDPPGQMAARALFERRVVLLQGPLDDTAATGVAAQLMTLDAESDEPVEVLVNSPGGPLGAVVPVLDVVDLLRGAVDVTCTGQALGTAAVVVACATGRRRATPRARLGLRLGETSLEGAASQVAQDAAALLALRDDLLARLALATSRPAEELRAETDRGTVLSAEEALAANLLDEVTDGR